MQGANRWPRQPAGYEQVLSTYFCQLRAFCRLMTKSVALSLDLPESYFDSAVSHPGCTALIAHYPPQGRGSASRGLDAHTDSECKDANLGRCS